MKNRDKFVLNRKIRNMRCEWEESDVWRLVEIVCKDQSGHHCEY